MIGRGDYEYPALLQTSDGASTGLTGCSTNPLREYSYLENFKSDRLVLNE
jgi:hypothetical protein